MKNLKFLTLAIAILGFTATSFAQSEKTASSDAKATIITPLSIENNTELNFGSIAPSSSVAGTVILDASATASRNPSTGISLPEITVTATAAKFTVTGEGNSAFTITLPAEDVTLTGSVSGTMTIASSSFTSSTELLSTALEGGTKVFFVGGTLNVGANQAKGDYTGTFDVTVNYN